MESIRKRDGRIEHFDEDKITAAIFKAAKSVGGDDIVLAKRITSQVAAVLDVLYKDGRVPTVENVQDLVEKMLIEGNHAKTAKAYILYRQQHSEMRQAEQLINHGVVLMDNYIDQADWRVNENSNMSYSLQGLNNHISSAISATYWLEKIYPQEVGRAHRDGTLHIHDLGILSVYCCGWDMELLLSKGLGGVSGKVESCPPKHFRTALGQIVNYFYTLQGEAAGAQAFSNFDTYLAPFIRYDQIRYKEVKQAMQEFIFNVNVPTRVGFQCMSEDTEILGKDGWKTYKQIKKNDTIATFNTEKGIIEYLPVNHVFKKQYKGKMFNLTNRISDQLISPEHRIVRKKFGTDNYVLEKIEDAVKLKSPFIVPIGSNGNKSGNHNINIDIVKLIAWIVAEGTIDRSGRGIGRISIFQSKIKSEKNYKEIISICKRLKFKWTERIQKGIGEECNVI
ncbi:ribonucleoside triphosphate reductase, partial [candidate division WOR-3 bacterium]|nr:ribonucleoside triphosphate reductase [candidate division WOR-3 bacterium]